MTARRWSVVAICCIAVLVAMVVVFVAIKSVGNSNWIATNATVAQTDVRLFRSGGPPEWTIFARLKYEVDSRKFTTRPLNVFSSEDKAQAMSVQRNWPQGRVLRIFHHPDNPEEVSLASDGGREALAVVAAILTPMLLVVVMLFVFIVRRHRQSRHKVD